MKAVVTGGAGFIGSHLSEHLVNEGHKVTVLDNFTTGRLDNLEQLKENVEVVEAELSSTGKWQNLISEADTVFHLASLADIVPSIEDPRSYFNSNVLSTLNVLEAARKNKTKVIYAASSSCYGIADNYPTSEQADIRPEYPYALTKRLGEEMVMHWGKVYSLPVISTRFFNVYGVRSRTSGTYGAVFGVFLAQKLAKKPLTIVGDGNQKRDFTYVTDIVKGLIQAAEADVSQEIFNLGSGEPKSINQLADLIGGDRIYIPKRPGEPDVTHANISKAQRMISYKPKVKFKEGVQRTLENIDYWKDAPVWTAETIQTVTGSWFKNLS